MGWLEDLYPTTIVCDRYSGAYSHGKWLAFPYDWWDVPSEVEGGDTECWLFWQDYNGIVGKGDTPQSALEDLTSKMKSVYGD